MRENETAAYLAQRASKGDEASFAALCAHLQTKLFRTAKGILGNETLALDAVSEAVYRAFKGIKRLRKPQYAETWFIRIVINAARDLYRRRKHETLTDTTPDGVYYDDHSGIECAQLLESLPGELREIISLKYYSDYTLAEIAAILQIPEGTVKSRLHRALALLRLEVFDEQK